MLEHSPPHLKELSIDFLGPWACRIKHGLVADHWARLTDILASSKYSALERLYIRTPRACMEDVEDFVSHKLPVYVVRGVLVVETA
jgi:hypothetical protein